MGTILLSGIDEPQIERLRYWAARQKLTPGEYVARLLALHEDLRLFAETASESREIADLLRANDLD